MELSYGGFEPEDVDLDEVGAALSVLMNACIANGGRLDAASVLMSPDVAVVATFHFEIHDARLCGKAGLESAEHKGPLH